MLIPSIDQNLSPLFLMLQVIGLDVMLCLSQFIISPEVRAVELLSP